MLARTPGVALVSHLLQHITQGVRFPASSPYGILNYIHLPHVILYPNDSIHGMVTIAYMGCLTGRLTAVSSLCRRPPLRGGLFRRCRCGRRGAAPCGERLDPLREETAGSGEERVFHKARGRRKTPKNTAILSV